MGVCVYELKLDYDRMMVLTRIRGPEVRQVCVTNDYIEIIKALRRNLKEDLKPLR